MFCFYLTCAKVVSIFEMCKCFCKFFFEKVKLFLSV